MKENKFFSPPSLARLLQPVFFSPSSSAPNLYEQKETSGSITEAIDDQPCLSICRQPER